jgi:Cu(I)/Ag(I) efflux system periplasmic protein CusF
MIMMKVFSAVLAAGALLAPLAHADDAHHKPAVAVAQADAALADGEVRKVDKDAKKITIKHGPLANLDMPPMTMVFQVKDPAMLDQVKAGDKVKFQAEKVGGGFTVTKIEPAK